MRSRISHHKTYLLSCLHAPLSFHSTSQTHLSSVLFPFVRGVISGDRPHTRDQHPSLMSFFISRTPQRTMPAVLENHASVAVDSVLGVEPGAGGVRDDGRGSPVHRLDVGRLLDGRRRRRGIGQREGPTVAARVVVVDEDVRQKGVLRRRRLVRREGVVAVVDRRGGGGLVAGVGAEPLALEVVGGRGDEPALAQGDVGEPRVAVGPSCGGKGAVMTGDSKGDEQNARKDS